MKLIRSKPTPYYIYDLKGIKQRCQLFKKSLGQINSSFHYAMKANANPKVLKTIKSSGYGVDVVSLGELKRALGVGFRPSTIIFSGVGKTVEEISFAIKKRIKQINVESIQELERIIFLAKKLKVRVPIGIRINPNINPKTHPYITTGFKNNKFGIDFSLLHEVEKILSQNLDQIKFLGFSIHVGSQIRDLSVFRETIKKGLDLTMKWNKKGWGITRIDVGGGLGIDYTKAPASDINTIKSYCKLVVQLLKNSNLEVMLEPGRIIVARFGYLVSEVQYIKKTKSNLFAVLNTGSHHLIRPALYGSFHRIIPLVKRPKKHTYQVVGPLCESSDFLARNRKLSELRQGDTVVIADCGAYGYSMASYYNLHNLPEEICV